MLQSLIMKKNTGLTKNSEKQIIADPRYYSQRKIKALWGTKTEADWPAL